MASFEFSSAGGGNGTASNVLPTSRQSTIKAPIECLLKFFLNKCSLSDSAVHLYLSSAWDIKRIWAGSTARPRWVSEQVNQWKGVYGAMLRSY